MMITPLQIDLWRRAPSESQILEYKEAKSGFDREKLAQYIVAKPPNIFPADATTILGAITGATLAAAEGTFGFLHLRRALSLAPRFGRSTADTPEVCLSDAATIRPTISRAAARRARSCPVR